MFGDGCRGTAESIVDAYAKDVRDLCDVDKRLGKASYLRCKLKITGGEIVVAVLDETGQRAVKGIFSPNSDGPPRPCGTRLIGCS